MSRCALIADLQAIRLFCARLFPHKSLLMLLTHGWREALFQGGTFLYTWKETGLSKSYECLPSGQSWASPGILPPSRSLCFNLPGPVLSPLQGPDSQTPHPLGSAPFFNTAASEAGRGVSGAGRGRPIGPTQAWQLPSCQGSSFPQAGSGVEGSGMWLDSFSGRGGSQP